MPALYPSMVAPEQFSVGDCVRKWVTEWNMTPFVGVVTHIIPKTYKVWVQWPIEHSQESPETLIKVNPDISGMPTSLIDSGYDSYEKSLSEKCYGKIPKRIVPSRDLPSVKITASDKMAIRIAHTFATNVIGRLIDCISECREASFSDVQAYNATFNKFGEICSDYIIKSSIKKIYSSED